MEAAPHCRASYPWGHVTLPWRLWSGSTTYSLSAGTGLENEMEVCWGPAPLHPSDPPGGHPSPPPPPLEVMLFLLYSLGHGGETFHNLNLPTMITTMALTPQTTDPTWGL